MDHARRIVRDFPPDERRPLTSILRLRRRGKYSCFLAKEDGRAVGYVCCLTVGGCILLDYLAVYESLRGSGFGAKMLEALRGETAEARVVLGEVEDPDFAESPADRERKQRRLNFYLRAGWGQTDLRAETFGTPYRIITMDPAEGEDLAEIYRAFYRACLPPAAFERFVHVSEK